MTDVPRGPDAQHDASHLEEFGRRYPVYHQRIRRYIRLRYPTLDAEAIANEVTFRAWRNWEMLRLRPEPMSWIFAVARNLAIDMLRSTSEKPTEIDDSDVALVARFVDADTRLELAETFRAMGQLPERQREALALSGSGLTPQEIADSMSCQVTTVYQYLTEGRSQLERIIGRPRPHSRGRPRPLPPENTQHRDNHPDREDQ